MLLFFVSSGRLFLNFLPINISAGDNPCSTGAVRWISNLNDGSLHFLSMFFFQFFPPVYLIVSIAVMRLFF